MTNHFHAIDDQGVVHTRSSKSRTYTHTVVMKLGRAYAERALARTLAYTVEQAPKNYAYLVSETDGTDQARTERKYPGLYTQAHYDNEKAKALAELAGRTVEQYVADELAEKRAKHAAELAKGYYDKWINLGWCGRPDLAQKLASKPPHWTAPEATAILVAQVGKPPKA